jgi:hypothetical protein
VVWWEIANFGQYKNDYMESVSILDERVASIVQAWLKDSGDLLVDIYVPHSGAGGTFFLISTLEQFHQLVEQAHSGSIFTIFRQPKFPIRGTVDDAFIEKRFKKLRHMVLRCAS